MFGRGRRGSKIPAMQCEHEGCTAPALGRTRRCAVHLAELHQQRRKQYLQSEQKASSEVLVAEDSDGPPEWTDDDEARRRA